MAESKKLVLVAATNNAHKVRELSRLFPGCELLSPADIGCSFHYEESANTYLGNALGKAMHLYDLLERPVVADDSGLEVPALDGEPGIYSSRYGSADGETKLDDGERNAYLLQRAQGIRDRSCSFICCMVLVFDRKRFFAVQETFPGILAHEPSGSGGFGYDPVVYIPEKERTVAQLSDAEKDELSHRGKAARRIAGLLESLRF